MRDELYDDLRLGVIITAAMDWHSSEVSDWPYCCWANVSATVRAR
jgi:hypothetical protein